MNYGLPMCRSEAEREHVVIALMQDAACELDDAPDDLVRRFAHVAIEALDEFRASVNNETFDRDWTIAPGETLRDWMEENKLTPRVVATVCGRMPVEMIEAILTGKQKITETIAEALAHGTGIPASLWLNLERTYRADIKAGRTDTTDRRGVS